MNFLTDRPISTVADDLLGRELFANYLAEAISEYNREDCLVIGLYGSWGTGKTSIINMALDKIEQINQSGTKKLTVMKFSPWNYTDKNDLIRIFFQFFNQNINEQKNEALRSVGAALYEYSEAFMELSRSVVGEHGSILLKFITQCIGRHLKNSPDLGKTRDNLEKKLQNAKEKFIIVIDDIDRLSNNHIKDIFQLVKQVADFSNVIYVLAMDREIVCNALGEVQNLDGKAYLDKIIQIPFEIPLIRKPVLQKIFFNKLDDVVKEKNKKNLIELIAEQEYWKAIYQNCVEPYMNTVRDINRFINTFRFKYNVLYKETSLEDMVGITVLEVLEPNLYKWVYQNKRAICGNQLSDRENNQYLRQQYFDEFNTLNIRAKLAIKAVATLFPIFANKIQETSYESKANLRGKMRIADNDKFDLYFIFTLEEIKVSRNVIQECIYESDEFVIKRKIQLINENCNIKYFLQELESLIDEIPQRNLSKIASALLDLKGTFKNEESKNILEMSVSGQAESLAFDSFIPRIKNDEERYELIKSKMESIDPGTLWTLARLMCKLELSHGRFRGKTENRYEEVISLDNLENLEKIFIDKIHAVKTKNELLDLEGFSSIFFVWELIDQKDAKEYIDTISKTQSNIIKFICSLAVRWSDSNGNYGWSFNEEQYSKYFSKEDIFQLLLKSKNSEFSKENQIKIASFICHYYNIEISEHKALEFAKERQNKK